MSRQALIEAIQKHGIVYAPEGQMITLASGAQSKFYIDFDRVVMQPSGASAVVSSIVSILAYQSQFDGLEFNAIGGPSSGADPIIGALMSHGSMAFYAFKEQVRGFKVRKEPKGRGPDVGAMIEGYLNKGDKAVVIEDVTTSGGSVLKAIDEIEKVGAKVVKVITLLDRLAGAGEKLAKYNFQAIATLNDLHIGV